MSFRQGRLFLNKKKIYPLQIFQFSQLFDTLRNTQNRRQNSKF